MAKNKTNKSKSVSSDLGLLVEMVSDLGYLTQNSRSKFSMKSWLSFV